MTFDRNNVYDTGLALNDWSLLRDALLYAVHNRNNPAQGFDALPQALRDHEIGRIIGAHLSGDESASLNDAANLMVGGMDNAWLALEK